MTPRDATEEFSAAIQAAGLTPPDKIVADGKLHRFACNGKRNDDAGWYVYHGDGIPAGAFGSWRSGQSQNWHADLGRRLSPVEIAAHAERVANMRREREAEEARLQGEARSRAAGLWAQAQPAPANHPYLVRKGVASHGLRVNNGALVIPMRDASGELSSLQFITSTGAMRFLTNGRVAGCYFSIGAPDGVLCIVEGFATGASVHESTGHAVACAMSAVNLEPVARSLRAQYPDLRIIICADDDHLSAGNPGLAKATEAARAVDGLLAVPVFGADRPPDATDFNDLMQHRGSEAVNRSIANARVPDIAEGPSATGSATAGQEWPEPQPLTVAEDDRPYPIDALPADIRKAVAEVVAFVQCPPALAACSALSTLSVACQSLADVRRDEHLEGPTSLYFASVGDSGERKTSCDDYFLKPVREWEREQAEQAKPDLAKHAAAVSAWEERCAGVKARLREAARKGEDTSDAACELETLEAQAPKPVRVPSLIHADATPEALTWSLARGWPSGGVISNEAGIVFGGHGMGRDSVMRNLALLNVLWDGGTVRVERRGSECFTLSGPRLTMGLAVQSDVVRQFMEATKGLARGSGFAARLLWAAPASTQGHRFFRKAGEWRHLPAFRARLRELLSMQVPLDDNGCLKPPALTLTNEARAVWIRFHDDVEGELRPGGDMAEVRDVASKAADNVARMAALFHLYAHGSSGQIGADAVTAAAIIVGWHLYQARRFLGEVAAPRERANALRLYAWLIDYCQRNGLREIERRTVQNRGPNPIRGKAALEAALTELAEAGRIKEVEDGRRKRLVRINPALLAHDDGAS
jgi:putative DNA primase/helicase